MADVLVVGSGGREHALSWKLSSSPQVGRVFVAPGNGGTENNVGIAADDISGLAGFAGENGCFTVVGPEAPLAMGIVDEFERRGLGIFGPTRAAARLEHSKAWAKAFMQRHGIPTARFAVFDDAQEALAHLDSVDYDVVVKADGLASGKGVVVCGGRDEAASAVESMMVGGRFGDAGRRVVIEERIDGVEASFIVISDGTSYVPLSSSQDHKRIGDGDSGPNTGGMGAYAPAPAVDGAMHAKICDRIIGPTIAAMGAEGAPVRGFVYAGIMMRDGEPYVLEYNIRMGDPECQPVLMRMDSDLYPYLRAAAGGGLGGLPAPAWRDGSAACVVLASEGYPGGFERGEEITGLDGLPGGAVAFHAGTRRDGDRVLSDGGRVLGVTARGPDLDSAVRGAYEAAGRISWPHKYCRTDIGKRGPA